MSGNDQDEGYFSKLISGLSSGYDMLRPQNNQPDKQGNIGGVQGPLNAAWKSDIAQGGMDWIGENAMPMLGGLAAGYLVTKMIDPDGGMGSTIAGVATAYFVSNLLNGKGLFGGEMGLKDPATLALLGTAALSLLTMGGGADDKKHESSSTGIGDYIMYAGIALMAYEAYNYFMDDGKSNSMSGLLAGLGLGGAGGLMSMFSGSSENSGGGFMSNIFGGGGGMFDSLKNVFGMGGGDHTPAASFNPPPPLPQAPRPQLSAGF